MHRQAEPDRRHFAAGQEQAVLAEVLEAVVLPADTREHTGKHWMAKDLAGKQVMALEPGVIAGPIAAIDRVEGQVLPRHSGFTA